MKTVAIVPIKKKSERVVGKNFRLVGGKPLYQHLLDKLNHSLFDEIYIDSDSEELWEYSKQRDILSLKESFVGSKRCEWK